MKNYIAFVFMMFSLSLSSQKISSGGVLKPEQAIMDVRHYKLVLEVDPERQSIAGYTEIDIITSSETKVLLFDLVAGYDIHKVMVNNSEQPFEYKENFIWINLEAQLAPGKAKVKIEYSGKPIVAARPPWDGGFTWSKDSNGNHWIAISCQSEGAKIFFPCKDHPSDEPNEGAELVITVPEPLVVAGPGLLKEVKTRKKKSTYHWETNYTINNYSILFNIGKYEVVSRTFTTCDGNEVPMQFYVLEENVDKAEHHLDILEKNVRVEEKYFGEYPWINDKIAICETPHLGMEHQTLNAYGNEYKYDTLGGQHFDWLMHHELGHEWWGNKVTGIDWSDMWIQEGICVFGDALFTLEYGGEEAYLKRMKQTARATRNKLPVKMEGEMDSDTVYHSDIYGKGAFFMHTMRYVIGDDDLFFATLKKFATAPEYTYDNMVSTDDAEKFFSKESGKDLKPLFDFFLRTINKLDFKIIQLNETFYQIELLNYDSTLPIDIITDKGKERVMISKDGIEIQSTTTPIIDPDVYYLKRVIQEW